MRWFEPFAAPPDLRDRLACRYAATADGRHDLIPDGCMDLLWIDGVGVVLCGPDTHAWSFELPAGTAVVGVRFRPGAAAGVFGVDAGELQDERVGLGDLVGGRVAGTVEQRLADAGDPVERLRVLEDLVRRRAAGDPPDGTVELAALVATDPAYGVDGLAVATGVSARQLRRRFHRTIGYGPAFFARIARVQRFARGAARSPGLGIAELAVVAGYTDQPHVAKDCRAIVGMTPRELITALPRTSVAVAIPELSGRGRSVQDEHRGDRRAWVA